MSLEFRRRRFHKPGKKMQLVLASILLLIAAGFVVFWVAVRLHQPTAPAESSSVSSADPSAVQADPAWEPTYLLILLTDEEAPRAVLLRSDPLHSSLQATPLSPAAWVSDSSQLDALYRKEGAAAVTAAVAAALDIPLGHYVALRYDEVESWLNYLENGLTLTLPEPVQSGALRLEAGERSLTATQSVNLLRYTGWSTAGQTQTVAADAVTAMLNQYFRAIRYLEGDFSALSNLCKTDLRISDFTADKARLTYLTAQNQGSLCRTALPEWQQRDGEPLLQPAPYTRAVTR